MSGDTVRQTIVVLAVVAVVVVNGLANALPLNGQTTAEISDRFQVLFVPAGYVFSIWGVIYLGLIGFAVFQALPGQRENPRLRRIGPLFLLSCTANIGWLFTWHYELFPLSLVLMLLLLELLVGIYLNLDVGRAQVAKSERWLVHAPLSVYLGWITVATIANAASVLDYLDWSGWGIGPEQWTAIMLLVATTIASVLSLRRGDVLYMLTILWAFVGIAIRHAQTPLVAEAAWVMTAATAIMLLVGAVKPHRDVHVPEPTW